MTPEQELKNQLDVIWAKVVASKSFVQGQMYPAPVVVQDTPIRFGVYKYRVDSPYKLMTMEPNSRGDGTVKMQYRFPDVDTGLMVLKATQLWTLPPNQAQAELDKFEAIFQ